MKQELSNKNFTEICLLETLRERQFLSFDAGFIGFYHMLSVMLYLFSTRFAILTRDQDKYSYHRIGKQGDVSAVSCLSTLVLGPKDNSCNITWLSLIRINSISSQATFTRREGSRNLNNYSGMIYKDLQTYGCERS